MCRFYEDWFVLNLVQGGSKQRSGIVFVSKNKKSGDVLISQRVTPQVSSALRSLTTGGHPPSIIGAKELNYCVRDGNRWNLLAIVTGFKGYTLKIE